MRILKLTLLAALALTLGAATASASSINVIWQVSGTGTTTVAPSSTIIGDIVMSIGVGDTGFTVNGSIIQVSADSNNGNTISTGYPAFTLTGWTWLAYPTLMAGGTHLQDVFAQADLSSAMTPGQDLAPGSVTTIGTVTVHVVASGTVIVSTNNVIGVSAPAGGDGLFGSAGNEISSQFSFGGGNIIVPEPATASLLGLGLLGLTLAGRQRKR